MFKFIFLLLLICSCASDAPQGKTEAEVIYKEALQMIESGRLIMANERLNTLKSQHPYSYYATHAELLQADILFKQENYVESAAAYLLFRDFHPKHKQIDYVVWMIAESYYHQLPDTFDRDLSSAHEAMKYYKEVAQKYPDYKDAAQAQEKIKSCERMLQQKEEYIADFYYRTEVFQAARIRYIQILEQFPQYELRERAMVRIADSSRMMGEYDQCLQEYQNFHGHLSESYRSQIEDIKTRCDKKDNS